MAQQKISLRFIVLIGLVIIAAMTRLLPHPPNFAPIGALALFGAAYFRKPLIGLIVTFAALWISDLLLNNLVLNQYYEGFQLFGHPWVYLGFAGIFALGYFGLKKVKAQNLLLVSIVGSLLFFLVTNFGAWQMSMVVYPKTLAGLLAAYTAGIPFLWNSMVGDLFYVAVLFGSFELLKYKFPQLAIAK